jgi:hypothetical protein
MQTFYSLILIGYLTPLSVTGTKAFRIWRNY